MKGSKRPLVIFVTVLKSDLVHQMSISDQGLLFEVQAIN
jgi:hypothetical protein